MIYCRGDWCAQQTDGTFKHEYGQVGDKLLAAWSAGKVSFYDESYLPNRMPLCLTFCVRPEPAVASSWVGFQKITYILQLLLITLLSRI